MVLALYKSFRLIVSVPIFDIGTEASRKMGFRKTSIRGSRDHPRKP